jgi:hypothetical protein
MRIKVAVAFDGFAISVVAALVLLLRPRAEAAVSLTFTGYSRDGTEAELAITNHTPHWIACRFPRIVYLTSAGWTNLTNFYDLGAASGPNRGTGTMNSATNKGGPGNGARALVPCRKSGPRRA